MFWLYCTTGCILQFVSERFKSFCVFCAEEIHTVTIRKRCWVMVWRVLWDYTSVSHTFSSVVTISAACSWKTAHITSSTHSSLWLDHQCQVSLTPLTATVILCNFHLWICFSFCFRFVNRNACVISVLFLLCLCLCFCFHSSFACITVSSSHEKAWNLVRPW